MASLTPFPAPFHILEGLPHQYLKFFAVAPQAAGLKIFVKKI